MASDDERGEQPGHEAVEEACLGSAKPSHCSRVISSRISGWRVFASIALPNMVPMPTPAPTAPRPPPTPRPMDFPALAMNSPDSVG